jgi:hypothetical protein
MQLVGPAQEPALKQNAGNADDNRRRDQRRPIAWAEIGQDRVAAVRAERQQGSLAEVRNPELLEDDDEPDAKKREDGAEQQTVHHKER